MSCTCEPCKECNQGYVWVSIDGRYLGKHRVDDMSDMEICMECNGTGLETMCEECMYLEAEEESDARET